MNNNSQSKCERLNICNYLLFVLFFFSTYAQKNSSEKNILKEAHIVVVIPSFNNKDWYKKNLDSVFFQNYKNYHILYFDDCSTDGTGELVKKYIKKHALKDRITLIQNKKRERQLANHYKAVHMCDDWDIVVNVDGDDWFAHPLVLQEINKVYQDPKIWITCGQYKEYQTNKKGKNPHIQENVNLRDDGFKLSHLRTFYAWLFKKIDKEDLLDEKGQFFSSAADVSFMIPMMEMAGINHRRYLPNILYIYNRSNPLNIVAQQHKNKIHENCLYCNADLVVPTHKNSHIIRYHRKTYKPLKDEEAPKRGIV